MGDQFFSFDYNGTMACFTIPFHSYNYNNKHNVHTKQTSFLFCFLDKKKMFWLCKAGLVPLRWGILICQNVNIIWPALVSCVNVENHQTEPH